MLTTMKKIIASLTAIAALALGVSLPAIAQNPDTPPAAADSTVTVITDVTLVATPVESDSLRVTNPAVPIPEIPEIAPEEAPAEPAPEEAAETDAPAEPEEPEQVHLNCIPGCCDKLMANHLSAGIALGLDGFGVQVALPLGPHFDVRAGYTFFPKFTKSPRELADSPFGSVIPDEEDLKFTIGDEADGRKVNLYDVPISLIINNYGPNLLFDYFPWKKWGFHVTAGAFINKGDFISVTADVSDQLEPDEYGTLGISFKNINDVTTDYDGVIRFDWRATAFRPYFGIGWGRPVNMKHRVSVAFDMGLVVLGSKGLYTYSYMGRSGVEDVEITSAGLENDDDGMIDSIAGLPVAPMMKLTVNVRLF